MNVSFSCFSLNVRGLRDITKRKSIFLFCKGERANYFFLQETHSNPEDEKFWINQWGDKIIFDHGTNKSAGLAILFFNSPGKLLTSKSSKTGHWLMCVLDLNEHHIILVNIYGFNSPGLNKLLLSEISESIEDLKLSYPLANIIVGGDFNMVYDEKLDRHPPRSQHSSSNSNLTEFCGSFNLLDPWRFNYPNIKQYSWFKPNDTTKSRIDFWLISASMSNLVSECSMSAAPLTDHAVIKLSFNPGFSKGKKGYWKFNSSLLKNKEFENGIRSESVV